MRTKDIDKKNIRITVESTNFSIGFVITPEMITQSKHPEKSVWKVIKEVFEKECNSPIK